MKIAALKMVAWLAALPLSTSIAQSIVVTDWTDTGNSATGTLGAVYVAAEFIGAGLDVATGGWDIAGIQPTLPAVAEAIQGEAWGAGDIVHIELGSAQADLLFCIRDFDRSGAATVQADGATDIAMISSDQYIAFTKTSTNTADLVSLQPNFGTQQGNCVIAFAGAVTNITMSWTGGASNNGVGYTLAQLIPPEFSEVDILRAHLIQFLSQFGRSHTLQVSDSLGSWSDTDQTLVGDGGVMSFCVESTLPEEFYRVRTQ